LGVNRKAFRIWSRNPLRQGEILLQYPASLLPMIPSNPLMFSGRLFIICSQVLMRNPLLDRGGVRHEGSVQQEFKAPFPWSRDMGPCPFRVVHWFESGDIYEFEGVPQLT